MSTPDFNHPDFAEFYDELPLWSAPFAQRLLERAPLARGSTILDVGCGTGFLAIELAQRCGAGVLAARALRESNAAGARPRRTALHGSYALTAREGQVATLAADGLSNKEIAETLVVTVKTVEWHLKHSYRKLGVSSRGQLADALGPAEVDA